MKAVRDNSIAAVLIVKNEEAMLRRCLESIIDVDQIVVVDTGSSDSTVAIAKEFTPHVYTDFEWCDDFAAARNHAKSKTTCPWVLSIDADEYLESGGVAALRKAVMTPRNAVMLDVTSENNLEHCAVPRLFRRELMWRGRIHELPAGAAGSRSGVRIYYGCSPAHQRDPDRALRILQTAVAEEGGSRNTYYLAREYFYRKNYGEALKWFGDCVKQTSWKAERADAYLYMARSAWQLRRGDDARHYCMLALLINSNFKEAMLFMAEISWPDNARVWRAAATQCNNQDVVFVRDTRAVLKCRPVDVIIPFSSCDVDRYAAFKYVVNYMQQHRDIHIIVATTPDLADTATLPGVQVVTTTTVGFNKCKLLNAGYLASTAPVVGFCDADTVVPSDRIYEAVAAVSADPGLVVRPFDYTDDLNAETSRDVIAGAALPVPQPRQSGVKYQRGWLLAAGLVFFSRDAFEACGGWDERFTGWGGEDVNMGHRVETCDPLRGKTLPGHAYHLWHTKAGPCSQNNYELIHDVEPRHLPAIPHCIHQIWLGPKPPPEKWLQTWRDNHPEWKYTLWRDSDAEALGITSIPAWQHYNKNKWYAGMANVMRVAILLRHGGVYIDADTECLHPLDGAEFMQRTLFAVYEADNYCVEGRQLIANSVIGAVPRHGLMQKYYNAIRRLKSFDPSWRHSGPLLFTSVLNNAMQAVPAGCFYPVHHSGNPARRVDTVYARQFWGSTHNLTADVDSYDRGRQQKNL